MITWPGRTVGEIFTAIDIDDTSLLETLSPRHFVDVRTTHGGPAPSETARAIDESRTRLVRDDAWFAEAVERLRAAEEKLRLASVAL